MLWWVLSYSLPLLECALLLCVASSYSNHQFISPNIRLNLTWCGLWGVIVPYHREEKIKCLGMSGCFNSSNNFSCTECCSFSVAKYLIHFHSCEEVHTEDKLAKFPITSPPVFIFGWLIRMLRFCQCWWLLNFWFVFWHTVSGIHQAFLLCALVFATLLTFGQHAEPL